MDKRDIISSGLLEAYITGDITDQQKADVEELLSTDSDVRREYLEIQRTLEHLAQATKVTPPLSIRDKLFNETFNNSDTVNDIRKLNTWRYVAAACVIFTLLSSTIAYNFWQRWKETSSQLLTLQEQNQQVAQDYNQVKNDLQNIKEDISVLVDPSFNRIVLSGTENAPQANAVVYWNPQKEQVFLNSSSLVSLDEGQQYQLWAIIDGTPVDAGVFDPKSGEFQNMKAIAKADAFAVTIEPEGGSDSPTLSTMQVFGKTG